MEEIENQKQQQRLPILFRLTRRCVLFFFLLLVSDFLFYISGNYQLFLDSNQNTILFLLTITAVTLAFFSLCGTFESIFYLIRISGRKKIIFIVYIVIMGGLFVFSVATAIISNAISIISSGV